MKLAVISDLHDSVEHIDVLRAKGRGADAVVVCGDFTTFGGRGRVQRMADAVRTDGVPLYFVLGNCDAMPVDGVLDGCCNLHGRVVEQDGWAFAGIGGSLPCPSPTPREFKETCYTRILESFRQACKGRADRLILVSHQPPFGTEADRLPSGTHVGCRALRDFIDAEQPACCLTGHIHEAVSCSHVGRTVVLNPGPFSLGNVGFLAL